MLNYVHFTVCSRKCCGWTVVCSNKFTVLCVTGSVVVAGRICVELSSMYCMLQEVWLWLGGFVLK